MELPSGRRYYRTRDLQKIMGVSRRTIERWGEAGVLPCIRVKGTLLFPIALTDTRLGQLERKGRKRAG